MESIEQNNVEEMIKSSDIAINPESGFAIVVIKPDAFKNKDAIIRRIENSGLYIVDKRERILPERFLTEAMYKDMPKDIEEQTIRHFSEGPSEILLVKGGENIIDDIVSLTGEKTNPSECSKDSIRFIFGEHFGRDTEEGRMYRRNAVHRAKDEKEQREDLKKFRDIP